MLTNTGHVAKLYLSIIDDVIENMRELFLDEGLEDRILDDLKHLWESKMMQSKALEDLRRTNINPSNFVLQLQADYNRNDQDVQASVVIPGNQNIQSFPIKNTSETLATFSLPAGLTYPVQIPAGVTLQTASGHLYKVNVPVVVAQAPSGQLPLSQRHKISDWREAPAPLSAAVPANSTCPLDVMSLPVPADPVTQSSEQNCSLPSTQEIIPPLHPPFPAAETSLLQLAQCSPKPVAIFEESEPNPQSTNLYSQFMDFQTGSRDALAQTTQLKTRDIDDILKEVIAVEREKAARLDLDYHYSELSDIVQLDGAADNSDLEDDLEGAPLEENDFLGIINAEAIKALGEEGGSSDGNSVSSSSDSEAVDALENIEEEDPLNSEDDVIEQDIPDLFDTENVIVCQYDKIHRSKNRWKFLLKDGVMCYGGRDYVFSKAVGEAEW